MQNIQSSPSVIKDSQHSITENTKKNPVLMQSTNIHDCKNVKVKKRERKKKMEIVQDKVKKRNKKKKKKRNSVFSKNFKKIWKVNVLRKQEKRTSGRK